MFLSFLLRGRNKKCEASGLNVTMAGEYVCVWWRVVLTFSAVKWGLEDKKKSN